MTQLIKTRVFILTLLSIYLLQGQIVFATDMVTYAGGAGKESFNDLIQISDGTYLVCGGADDLEWIKCEKGKMSVIEDIAGLNNSRGTNRYAFIMRLNHDLSQVLNVTYLPKGAAEEIRFMKTTNIPGQETGDLYISGNINHADIFSNNERPVKVFIAKLNNNFVKGVPTGFVWQHSFWSEDYVADYHPWDVGSNGNVVLAEGQSHNADYGAILMLDSKTGEYCIVPRWRNHRYIFHRVMNDSKQRDDFIEADFWGYPEEHEYDLTIEDAYERDSNFNIIYDENGEPKVIDSGYKIGPILYSRIYTKWTGGADMRSWTQEDFDMWQPDENGSYKKGKYPWDMMFSTPCNPNDIAGSTKQNEYGYTRYRTQGGAKAIFGTSSITIDRRNNDIYIGMNISSKLPDGNLPDFEPVVIAYSFDGEMKWWSRLYHETVGGTPEYDKNGKLLNVKNYQTNTSTPDQYVDAIAVDYSSPIEDGTIIVNARAHGNNIENLWEGNTIAVNPGANGFKNGFSGSGGDMHLGWLGRMKISNGQLLASTYVAEAANDAEFGSSILSDPNLDEWPNPNDGWLKLTTTRVVNNTLHVSANGYPVIIATGRRTITTSNANQKMYKPGEGESSWNSFVRVYNHDLSLPLYSSLATGLFGTDGKGGDNIILKNVWKTQKGVIAVGYTNTDKDGEPSGNDINLSNIPEWGKSEREGQDAVIFCFEADNIQNLEDGYEEQDLATNKGICLEENKFMFNGESLYVDSCLNSIVEIFNISGQKVISGRTKEFIDLRYLPKGIYIIKCERNSTKFIK